MTVPRGHPNPSLTSTSSAPAPRASRSTFPSMTMSAADGRHVPRSDIATGPNQRDLIEPVDDDVGVHPHRSESADADSSGLIGLVAASPAMGRIGEIVGDAHIPVRMLPTMSGVAQLSARP